MKSDPAGNAPVHRHYVNVIVTVIIARKRDPLTVGREYWIGFSFGVNGKALRILAASVGEVDVARVGKGEMAGTECRCTQQQRFVGRGSLSLSSERGGGQDSHSGYLSE